MRRWPIKRFVFASSMLLCSIASACPMCKDSIPHGESAAQAGSLPGGFNDSVYILLLGLFATIGLMVMGLVRGINSTNQRIISPRSSRGFEVRPSDSSPGETE